MQWLQKVLQVVVCCGNKDSHLSGFPTWFEMVSGESHPAWIIETIMSVTSVPFSTDLVEPLNSA